MTGIKRLESKLFINIQTRKVCTLIQLSNDVDVELNYHFVKMFWLKKLLLYSFAVFTVLYSYTTCQGFNSLLHKDIDANVTCGNPAEIYFRTQDGILHPRLRTPLVCDATDQKNAHPPAYMNDDNLGTFWQSKASIDKAEIRVDLNQVGFILGGSFLLDSLHISSEKIFACNYRGYLS